MEKKNALPEEYTVETEYSTYGGGTNKRYNRHAGEQIVKTRIEKALKKVKMSEAVKNAVRYEVRITDPYVGDRFTRVYIGRGYGWMSRHNPKVMVSSKKEQSVDVENVVKTIVERAEYDARDYAAYNKQQANERVSQKEAEQINKELEVGYGSGVYATDCSDPTKVTVKCEITLSPTEARRLIEVITRFKD